jgi:hypothetical protein
MAQAELAEQLVLLAQLVQAALVEQVVLMELAEQVEVLEQAELVGKQLYISELQEQVKPYQ